MLVNRSTCTITRHANYVIIRLWQINVFCVEKHDFVESNCEQVKLSFSAVTTFETNPLVPEAEALSPHDGEAVWKKAPSCFAAVT